MFLILVRSVYTVLTPKERSSRSKSSVADPDTTKFKYVDPDPTIVKKFDPYFKKNLGL